MIQENDGIPATEEVKMMRYMYKINERHPGGGTREVLPLVEYTRMLHLKGAPFFRLEVFKMEGISKNEAQERVRKTASWLLKRGFKIIYFEEK